MVELLQFVKSRRNKVSPKLTNCVVLTANSINDLLYGKVSQELHDLTIKKGLHNKVLSFPLPNTPPSYVKEIDSIPTLVPGTTVRIEFFINKSTGIKKLLTPENILMLPVKIQDMDKYPAEFLTDFIQKFWLK